VTDIGGLKLDHAHPARRAHDTPLLFVHGMCGGSWVFENYLAFAASSGWEAWAINLRGHHGSRPVARLGAVCLEDYVRDVDDVLEAIGPAIVIGHSMGGLVAQIVASRRELDAVVLVASAPPPGVALVHWSLAWRSLRYVADVVARRPLRVRGADLCALALNGIAPAARPAVARRFVPDSALVARQLALGRVAPLEPIRCPVLVVSGTEDRLIPPHVQRHIVARYGADPVAVLGRGHMLPVEANWRGPIGRILGWLDQRTS
jgi:pimeloyl-ACP methyl ester carboxylesterase